MTRRDSDPYDPVRDAFAGLSTAEKASFILEATFNTIGTAVIETGRRAATVLDDLDIDSWFRPPHNPAASADEPVSAPPPPSPRSTSSPKPTARKKAAPKKTAGTPKTPKRRPPADDAGDAL